MDEKKQKLAEARKVIYLRNKLAVEAFKDGKKCEACRASFPHYMLDFANDQIAKLVINRASPERLHAAMLSSPLFCLNHLAELKHNQE